jgi:hypothetical protein
MYAHPKQIRHVVKKTTGHKFPCSIQRQQSEVEVSKRGRVTKKKFEKLLYPVRAVKVENEAILPWWKLHRGTAYPVDEGRKTDEKPTTRQTNNALLT